MCNQLLFPKEQMYFADNMSPEVRNLLWHASQNYNSPERAEEFLNKARAKAPEQLEVYIALYKFYFYQKRLRISEDFARLALVKSAEQGEFNADWEKLNDNSTDWSDANGPARIYLYTMKALGFIFLRTLRLSEGMSILEKLKELDPNDNVGGSVVYELAEGLLEFERVANG